MKKNLFLLVFGLLLLNTGIFAQAVSINSTGAAPDGSAMLDVAATDKGLLIPRVQLDDATTAAPVSSPADGLMIYNATGSEPHGLYVWSSADSEWKQLYNGTVPTVPGNTEYWIRPDAPNDNYIHPEHNSMIKVYDAGETYGIHYDGGTNQYGIWARTTNVVDPTAAVVGFSDVSGNQTYGYLGFNGTYNSGTGFGSLDGMAVYGMVDDPNRAAGFFRTTGNASMASLISYSDVWIASYNFVHDARDTYSPLAVYGQLDVTVANQSSYSGTEVGVEGMSVFHPNSSNGAISIGMYGYAGGNDKDNDGYLDPGYQSTIGIYGSANSQGANWAVGVYGYSNCTANGSDYYNNNWGGTEGVGANNNIQYGFGVVGRDAGLGNRSGGVLGTWWTNVWSSLGYQNSGGNGYGIYYTSRTTTAKSNNFHSGIGAGGYGNLMGSWTKGEIYGMAVSGNRYSLYVDGRQYTNDIISQMNDNGTDKRFATYVPTSMTVDVYMKGTGKMVNGKAAVKFDENYLSIISESDPIIVTVTPIGKSNGIYLEEVKNTGFRVAENNAGKSNLTFNWIAIATRKGYNNPQIPEELTSKTYDNNLNAFMFNESDTKNSALPMWWDDNTQKLNFTEIPKTIDKSKVIDKKFIKTKEVKNNKK